MQIAEVKTMRFLAEDVAAVFRREDVEAVLQQVAMDTIQLGHVAQVPVLFQLLQQLLILQLLPLLFLLLIEQQARLHLSQPLKLLLQ